MKNITWKKIAVGLFILAVAALSLGIGAAFAAQEAAEFIIDKAYKIMGYEGITIDITKPELMEYYLKLKGGGC